MTARTDKVESVKNARPAKVVAIGDGDEPVLAATGHLAEFRCVGGTIAAAEGGIMLDAEAAEALGVTVGDTVWTVAR